MENTLGLDVHGSPISPPQLQSTESTQSTASPRVQRSEDVEDGEEAPEEGSSVTPQSDDKSKKEKGKPYVPVTPPARAKMSPEELAERMEKIKLQNEKIKERREHVKADEEAFNTSIAVDRAKQAASRKIQAQINQSREQNAKRKMEKIANREWDSGKHAGEWKQGKRPTEDKGRGNFFSSGSGRDTGGTQSPLHIGSASKTAPPKPQENTSDAPPSHFDTEESRKQHQ